MSGCQARQTAAAANEKQSLEGLLTKSKSTGSQLTGDLPLRDLTNAVEPLLAFSPESSMAQEVAVRRASS
jgi:hypothetical protein